MEDWKNNSHVIIAIANFKYLNLPEFVFSTPLEVIWRVWG